MTGARFYPVLFFAAFFAMPAHADALPDSGDMQKTLAGAEISIGDYELNRNDLNAFYAARDIRPAWNFAGQENSAALAGFLDSLDRLIDYHGLERGNYPIGLMRKLAAPGGEGGVKLELLVTDALLRLAHDLHGDEIDLSRLYPGWTFHRDTADIPAGLAAAIAANGLNDYIEGLAPKNPAYGRLAEALQIWRAMTEHPKGPSIAPGPILRLKDHGPRVAQLRARLAAEGYLPETSMPDKPETVFDDGLLKALLAWQLRNGLKADGQAGAKTVEALNMPIETRIDRIRANMERWRHMPDSFPPERYALVNIADASIDIVENGEPVYRGPVIVGRVDRKTPFIQSAIRSMIVNPAWHVPRKIAQKDILPKLRKDPHYLEKLGFVISGSEDDPHGETIDWKSMPEREFNFRLRQSPGDMNSLGRLKFDFDNDFAVYMHGTPHQELFEKDERTLSSGCVRLRDPEEVAEIVLAGNRDPWDAERIGDEIDAGKTRWLAVAKPLPLYILYWTVFAGDDGRINFRNDVYDYDRFLIDNMKPETKNETEENSKQSDLKTP